jgi:hypothetical protein
MAGMEELEVHSKVGHIVSSSHLLCLTCCLELSCPMDNSQGGEYYLMDYPTP